MRTTDTVARLGGDEFVVLLEIIGTDAASAARNAEDLLKEADAAMYQAKTGGRDCLHLHTPTPSS